MGEQDRDFWEDAYQQDPSQVEVTDQFLEAEIVDLEPGKALDLGCGSGTNTLKLAKLGWEVTGVDWADSAIKLARQAATAQGLNANFIVADITEWKPSRKFDLVISTFALPGGDMTRRTLETAVTALAKGGTLIVTEWDRSMSEAWGFEEDELLAPDQITALLSGLQIEKAEVRQVADPFSVPDNSRKEAGSTANVAFVRAQNPSPE